MTSDIRKNHKGDAECRLKGAQIPWQRMRGYHRRRRELDVTSGTVVWYRIGQPVLPLRWVLVSDPTERLSLRAFCSTCTNDRPRAVAQQLIKRWTIETTFEESRTHRDLEPNASGRIAPSSVPYYVSSVSA